MNVALIGLGRMGKNIAIHLLEQKIPLIVYSRSLEKVGDMEKTYGALPAYSLKEIAAYSQADQLIVFLFVPSGAVVDEVIFGARGGSVAYEKDLPREKIQPGLIDILPKGSIIIDGGNSFYQDSQRRYLLIKEKGLHFLDMGTSGGIDGARNGACLMVGGDEAIYQAVKPILAKIATADGYGYFGAPGAGHYIKMIHNAIEYGMMGAIAEGFNLVKESEFMSHDSEKINLEKLAKVWAHKSIISGHLMSMAQRAFTREDFENLSGMVPRGETEIEMEWIGKTNIPNPVIQAARIERTKTRENPSFIGRLIAALRREFGAHAVDKN